MATILVVDDETFITDLLRDLLEEDGYRVCVAHNGREALRIARAERPDLVLSDVMMPVMDGTQLLEALGDDPVTAATRVILMSAVRPTHATRTRPVAFVGKPFAIAHLLALVARAIPPNAGSPQGGDWPHRFEQ